jgi:hypothetical protein
MTDVLCMLSVITECSKHSRKISVTKLDIGDPIADPMNGL